MAEPVTPDEFAAAWQRAEAAADALTVERVLDIAGHQLQPARLGAQAAETILALEAAMLDGHQETRDHATKERADALRAACVLLRQYRTTVREVLEEAAERAVEVATRERAPDEE